MNKTRISEVTEPVSLKRNLLVCVSRRLLTEGALVTINPLNMNVPTELLTVRATMMAGIMSEKSGYSHYGIND